MRKILVVTLCMFGLAHAQDAKVGVTPDAAPAQQTTQPVVSTPSSEAGSGQGSTNAEAKTGYASSPYGYKDGFFIQTADGKFAMTISGWVQTLFTGQRIDSGTDTDVFNVRRARIQFRGYVFDPQFQYSLDYDISSNKLRNTYLQWVASQGFKIRSGYWKVPFDFEAAAISYQFQFIDRSIAYTQFGVPELRESGVGFNGKLLDKKLEYEVAVMNGEPMGNLNNHELRYAGRLVYNVAGQNGYEVSDLEASKEFGMALGAGAMYNDTPDPSTFAPGTTLSTSELKTTSLTGDASFKYRGFGAMGAFLFQNINPDIAAKHRDTGFVAQLGYFVIPNKLELAGRVAHIFTGNDKCEATFGTNYYIMGGNHVKLQLDYSALKTQNGIAAGDDRLDHRVRAQFQIRI